MPRKQKETKNTEDLIDEEPPTQIDPYQVLGLQKDATADQVKKAYRKAALQHHPDKAKPEDKDAAHKTFQEIAFAYAILSDDRRRKRYDLTGHTEESAHLDDDDVFDWASFYRAQFEDVITPESIEKFKAEYKASEEEREALLEAYREHEGDMDRIYEVVMLSDPLEDDERFRKIIDEAIEKGGVPPFDKYTKEPAKKRKARIERAKRDGKEAMELAEKLGVKEKLFGNGKGKKDDGEAALAALIQQRQKARGGNFLADLEAKYAPKSRRKREAEDEPPEEAFQRTATRAKGSKSKRSKA